MKDRLFIRLLPEHDSLEWGLLNQQEEVTSFIERGHLLLEDAIGLAEYAVAHPVTLIIPSNKVRNFRVKAPTKNKKQLEQAIPYILEEQIIENVDSQHFAIGSVKSNGEVTVNVIAKDYLSNLLDVLKKANIEPDFLLTDAACLPVFDDAWTILDQETILVRQAQDEYWSSDKEMAIELLKWNLEQQIEEDQAITQAVRIFADDGDFLSLEGEAGFAVQKMSVEDEFLWLVSQNIQKEINLLQGSFSSTKKSKKGLGVFKLPLIAASVLMFVGLVYLISSIFTLIQERNSYQEQIAIELNKVKLNSTTSEDIASSMYELDNRYSKLGARAEGGQSLIQLLDKSFAVVKPLGLKFSEIEYMSRRGQLSFDVIAADYQTLTTTQNALEKTGLDVEMVNARENGGSWGTRLVIKVAK